MTGQRLTEAELIATLLAPISGPGGLALKDDAACLTPPPGHDLVVTTDALVAGVHFFSDDPPASIARKALRVSLSDLAAKGAAPLGFVLSLCLPPDWTLAWMLGFVESLGQDALAYRCPLVGGDTVRMPGPLTLSVTALGAVPHGRMVARTGARPGDQILVTGTIGDAALGLALRRTPDAPWAKALGQEDRDHLADRYLHPQPRNALFAALRDHAHAAMDVSDGLIGDVIKLLIASGVSGSIDLDAVPMSPAAARATKNDVNLVEIVMTGGDDYEVICTVPPEKMRSIRQAAELEGVPITAIGTVVEGNDPPVFADRNGRQRFVRVSYAHY